VPSKVTQTAPLERDSFKDSPLEHVRALFAGFVQGLFYAAPPGAYHWDPNGDVSEIFIADEGPIKTEALGQRPGVSFTRGPVQFYSLGLDDMLGYNAETGTKQKSVLVPGTMTINCISRVVLESERLAWIIAEQLWANRELLMKEGFFEIGRQPIIGAPSPAGSLVMADQGDEYFATSVSCPYQFYRTTNITPLNKKIIGSMGLILRQRALTVGPNQGPITAVSIEGYMPPHFSPASDATGNTPMAGGVEPCRPLVPHPLNPAQMVVVRAVRPNRPGLRPASIAGRTIPLTESCVPESSPNVTISSKVQI